MTGSTLGPFRILEKLGEGGMGVVYKAEDTNLGRTVALKFLAPHLLDSEEHKQRFLREAKAAASLDHPNICLVLDVGELDGRIFLTMGYVDGPEVRAKIRDRPLKLDEALDIAIQTSEGLRAAHQKGIVHRDIKSSNLMLTSSGQVKIMDFGLAQLASGTRLTKTETVLGTPAYMSPEQAQRLETDRRTDIWSLGVVLYEMVTGRLPFEGEREAAVVHSIIHQPHEPITAIRAGVPLELDRIVSKALAKKPDQRYQHLDDMLVDLRALRAGVIPAATVKSRPRWLWAALVPLLLAAGYFAWRSIRPSDIAEPVKAIALTTFPGAELYPSLSPDANHVTFAWDGPKQDNQDIYVQQIGAGAPLRLTTDPRADFNPVWSPDGKWIAFLRGDPAKPLSRSERELLLIPPLGGPERKLAAIRVLEITLKPAFLNWCPDSKCLIVTDSTGEGKPDALFAVSVETGEKRQVTNPQAPVLADTNPAVSAETKSLLFLRRSTWAFGEPHILPLNEHMAAAGEVRRLATGRLKPDSTTWLPGGDEILFSAGAISGAANLWRLSAAGNPPSRLPYAGEDGLMPTVAVLQPAKPARLVYVRSLTDENIWRVDLPSPGRPAASPPSLAISSTKADIHCMFSPDGSRVAFTSTRSGAWEIWTSNPDGSAAVQLTFLEAPTGTGAPRWSPDGSLIVFASDAEGQFDILVVPSGGGKPRNITSHPALDHVPVFSRDGKWIYFSSNRSGVYQIYKVPVSGGDPVQVTTDGGWNSTESPDGADLYYLRQAAVGAQQPLWRASISGAEPVMVLGQVITSYFAVMRRGIYYVDEQSGAHRIQYYDFATRRSTIVVPNLGVAPMGGFTASPDGRTILFAKQDSSVDDLMLVENFR
ncbi:MAG: hypothetical protein FJW20_26595 [Acidimicrobiia bacterium]|nr:hypothetical protein [Acidimicrobiia bacterium]